jgi:hypothetical protein
VPENKDSFIQRLHSHLFDEPDEMLQSFDKRERDMVIRYRAAFTKWMTEPHLRDIEMVKYLSGEFAVSETMAYQDLPKIKFLIGNVRNASREFQRYRASEMILKGYQTALDATSQLEVKQAMAMIQAAQALGKVHKLDKEELDNLVFDDIIPLELEPSTDVSVIGHKPIENLEELKAKLRRKYGSQPIEDADYTEIEK